MKSPKELVSQMTIEEKSALIQGFHNWHTNSVKRLSIPAVFMTDGPHGLRKVKRDNGDYGMTNNEHSSAFPTAATVSCSWNPENSFKIGKAIAEECLAADVQMILGPGINIKRSPLCGRNFEYYSEDPEISGQFGAQFVKGLQSMGIGSTVKHFAVNSNEDYRYYGDSVVDERALREIYLRAFEKVIKEANPWAVMSSYNKVNGSFASSNKTLLTDILIDEWKYDGFVMTDWGAASDRVSDLMAGCDLEMPGDVTYNRAKVIGASKSGELPQKDLDRACIRILEFVNKALSFKKTDGYDGSAHAELSCQIAKDSAVLLKNDGSLPLKGSEKLLVVGELFENMRYQGSGSSLINPKTVITPKDAFDKRKISYTYSKGYRQFDHHLDPILEKAALLAAKNADTLLFFGGLTDFEESEGFDRRDMKLARNQISLLTKLLETGKKVIFVFFGGSPVELGFFDKLNAMVDMVLPGMYGGQATAAVLYGDTNPSGKLTESWPMTIKDTSCNDDYDKGEIAKYYESIYVGYRYYDKAKTDMRFPFGYGLSYTSFLYKELAVKESGGTVTAKLTVKNTGKRDGAEIVELYVKNAPSAVFKAEKELRAFKKVFLKAGEEKEISLCFPLRDISYYNTNLSKWVLENGTYEIAVGTSSKKLSLFAPLAVTSGEKAPCPYSEAICKSYANPPKTIPDCFEELVGYPLPKAAKKLPITMQTPLRDFDATFMGKIILKGVISRMYRDHLKALRMPEGNERNARVKNTYFLVTMMPSATMHSLAMSSAGSFTYTMASAAVLLANGHIAKGLSLLMTKEKPIPLPQTLNSDFEAKEK